MTIRRIGQSFTLAELADAYAGAEAWSREAVEETEPAINRLALDENEA